MKNVATRAKNIVQVRFSQNLTWVNKAGETKQFSEDQTFTTDTLTEVTSRKVGLWTIGVCKHFIKLSRLQGRTGFKMSKPVEMEITINNKTEKVSTKFTLSISRIESLLSKYPALVTEAFMPSPAIGNITTEQVKKYFTNAENLVIAAAVPKGLPAANEEENDVETIDIEAEVTTVTVPLLS